MQVFLHLFFDLDGGLGAIDVGFDHFGVEAFVLASDLVGDHGDLFEERVVFLPDFLEHLQHDVLAEGFEFHFFDFVFDEESQDD